MNSTVGGEQRKLGFNKRTRFIFFEVLVLLPSTSRSTVAPLLAVPAVLIILREILVSALREWTALAGLDLGTLGTLGMLRTGRSWSVVVDLFWAEETGVDFFCQRFLGMISARWSNFDEFHGMSRFDWRFHHFLKGGTHDKWDFFQQKVGFFSAKRGIFQEWFVRNTPNQEMDGNGGSFLRHA